MSELEEIKARAAERRKESVQNGDALYTHRKLFADSEADLDRAIAIAEERSLAYDALKDAADRQRERFQVVLSEARAAVLALRDAIKNPDKFVVSGDTRILYTLYADTESFEKYRKTDG